MFKTVLVVIIIHAIAFIGMLQIKSIPTENDGVQKQIVYNGVR